MSNPLLDFSGLPAFDRIAPEHVAPAVDALLARADVDQHGLQVVPRGDRAEDRCERVLSTTSGRQ